MHIINIFQFSASLFLLSKFSHRAYNILGKKKSSISNVVYFNSAVATPYRSDAGGGLNATLLKAQQITSRYGNTPQGEGPRRKIFKKSEKIKRHPLPIKKHCAVTADIH